jgi:predicted transcriptional regulator of viral defense system
MRRKKDYVTVEEMAEMYGLHREVLYRVLQKEQHKSPGDQRIPGAYKVDFRSRGEWRIPIKSAMEYRHGKGPNLKRGHYVTVQEMADMHGMNPVILYRILQREKGKSTKEQLIPGAFKVEFRFKGEWHIPIKSAQNFKRRKKGNQGKKVQK